MIREQSEPCRLTMHQSVDQLMRHFDLSRHYNTQIYMEKYALPIGNQDKEPSFQIKIRKVSSSAMFLIRYELQQNDVCCNYNMEQIQVKQIGIYAPLAITERGKPTKIGISNTHIAYCISNVVVVRKLENLNETSVFDQHKFDTSAVQFSASGNLCCSGDVRGNIFIWEVNSLLVSKSYENQLGGAIKDICWTNDGQRIVVAGEGKTYFAKAFLVDTGSSLGEITGVSKVLLTCDMRPNRPFRLVVAGEDFSVYWYEGPPFKFKKSSKQHQNFVNIVKFNKSGDLFVSGASDKKLFLYNGKTCEEIRQIDCDHTRSITGITWIGEQHFVTSSNDTTLKFYSTDGGLQRTIPIPNAHEIDDMQVSVVSLNHTVYSLGLNGSLNIFKDITQENNELQVVYGHINIVNVLISINDTLITGDNNGRILVWNKNNAKQLTGVQHNKQILGLVNFNNGIYSIAGEQIKFTSLDDLNIKQTVDCPGQIITIKNNSTHLFVLFENGLVVQYSAELQVIRDFKFNFECSCFDINDNILLIGDTKGLVHQISIESGAEIASSTLQHSKITCIKIKDSLFLFGDTTGKMKLIDFSTQKELYGERWTYHTTIITSLNFLSDKYVVSTSQDNKIMLWDLTNGQRAFEKTDAHKRGILNAIIFEGTLLTSGGDNIIKQWKFSI